MHERFNVNHDKKKSLEKQLKNFATSIATLLFVHPDLSFDQSSKISCMKKKIIVLESDEEYLAYTIIEKETKFE